MAKSLAGLDCLRKTNGTHNFPLLSIARTIYAFGMFRGVFPGDGCSPYE